MYVGAQRVTLTLGLAQLFIACGTEILLMCKKSLGTRLLMISTCTHTRTHTFCIKEGAVRTIWKITGKIHQTIVCSLPGQWKKGLQ